MPPTNPRDTDMTNNNPFFRSNPDAPDDHTQVMLSPAGLLLMCSRALHDDDAGAQGKVRAARLIHSVLDAARAAGYARGEIAETLLMDLGHPIERKQDVSLELTRIVGGDGFVEAMRRAGFHA